MDYLQYKSSYISLSKQPTSSFKPYYKWITFNTAILPSITVHLSILRFKPYYKWITFNTPKRYTLWWDRSIKF